MCNSYERMNSFIRLKIKQFIILDNVGYGLDQDSVGSVGPVPDPGRKKLLVIKK